MQKKDLEQMDKTAREFFDSLPAVMRESIMQSGVTMTTREQLETYCRNAFDTEN